jgi:hypothetical protein
VFKLEIIIIIIILIIHVNEKRACMLIDFAISGDRSVIKKPGRIKNIKIL